MVSVRVAGVGSTQADVVVGKKLAGRVHVSQVKDAEVPQQSGEQMQNGISSSSISKKRKKGGGKSEDGGLQQQGGGVVDAAVHLWHGNPLDTLGVGQQLEAVVLGRGGAGHHHGVLELSLKPSLIEAARKVEWRCWQAPLKSSVCENCVEQQCLMTVQFTQHCMK